MVARELAYNIVVGAVRQSNVDFVFGGINKQIQTTQEQLAAVSEEQRRLNMEIRQARREGRSYDDLQAQLEDTNQRAKELTATLSEQQDQLRDSATQLQKFDRWMKWSTASIIAATGALVAMIHVQGQQSRSLTDVAQITGESAETLDKLNNAAKRVTGQGFSPEQWLAIYDNFQRINEQFRLGTDLSEQQYIAYQRLGLNPFEAATIGAEQWYNALLKVDPALRDVTAQDAGITALYTALRPAIERQDTWNQVVGESNSLSAQSHREFARAKMELDEMGESIKDVGKEWAVALVPHMKDALATITPFIRAGSDLIEQNPILVKAMAAFTIGLGAVTTALWLANVAKSFFLSLTGVGTALVVKAGIVAGAVAIAGGVAFAGLGGFGSVSANQLSPQEQMRQADNNIDRVVGAVEGQTTKQVAVFERSRQELDPILRQLQCLERDMGATADTASANAQAVSALFDSGNLNTTNIGGEPWRGVDTETEITSRKYYSPSTPWGYLGEWSRGAYSSDFRVPEPGEMEAFAASEREKYGASSGGAVNIGNLFPESPAERTRRMAEMAGVSPERLDKLFGGADVDIVNHFYNNPQPGATIASETEREMRHLFGRK